MGTRDFDKTVREIFAPIYPVIVQMIVQKTGVSGGKCLDAGCGTGYLGMALGEMGGFHITFFDQSEEALELTWGYANERLSKNGFELMGGDIHDIPAQNESFDLVISRGSMFFWEDLQKAFDEIARVLKPEGKACIGGGFGNEKLRLEIYETMKKKNPSWKDGVAKRLSPETKNRAKDALEKIEGITYEIPEDMHGFWILITKKQKEINR